MKRFVLALAFAAACALPLAPGEGVSAVAAAMPPATAPAAGTAPAAASEDVVLVAGGTAIPLHVVGEVSSGKVKAGDTIAVQSAGDVVVHGMVVVRKGALGQGTIGEVDHAGGNGHSGTLAMSFDWVYAVDGGKIRLAPATQTAAEGDRKGASSTATIIGFATFGLGGLFGHNLAHGREVTIDATKVLPAFVADNVHVTTSEASAVDHFDR